jgi:UPF0755 protein
MKKLIIFALVAIPFVLLLAAGYVLTKPNEQPATSFTVNPGDTFGRINHRLHEAGLVADMRIFHYYTKYNGALEKFRAGNFTIPQGANMPEVLDALIFGQPNLQSVTIPEGKNMYEVARILEGAGITGEADFIAAARNSSLIEQLDISAPTLEGYLFPETYRFAPSTPATLVAKAMVELFRKKTESLDFSHPFLSKHQVIILASVIEKETGAKFERPAIAGVFTNRLRKKMRLQSDPTTIYGIWERYKGNIRKADLLEHTPYNTYKIPALPVGPISNPSLEAIQAALEPQDHDYLFFVSKNDGTHIFSRTYQEHNRAVDQYQRNVRARQGKSWRNLKQ